MNATETTNVVTPTNGQTFEEHANKGPYEMEYGKMMMWFLLITDLFSFGTLLIATYGYRFAFTDWPSPELVFTAFPFIHHPLPLLFVGLMTFILIISSLTMALAVDAGNRLDKAKVVSFLIYTIIGGIVFLACQAWEWNHMIHGGASLTANPWGNPSFGAFFFLITGFHGLHVLSGVIMLIILAFNVKRGVYDKRGHYLMVEKIGLYWHFVDLVWVFVFTFFYLI